MTPLKQPTRRSCGQTCIAMVLDKSVEYVVEELFDGHLNGTNTKKMVTALRRAGYNVTGLKRITQNNPIPKRSICKMRFRSRRNPNRWRGGWHWVLIWNGVLYDPLGPDHTHPYHAQISSFLDLTVKGISNV